MVWKNRKKKSYNSIKEQIGLIHDGFGTALKEFVEC